MLEREAVRGEAKSRSIYLCKGYIQTDTWEWHRFYMMKRDGRHVPATHKLGTLRNRGVDASYHTGCV